MANPASTKKQIIDSIKQANSILVTVSRNPSVDELSAALGLTIFLNKLVKHATAVFSGQVPPAITFLEPDKTFEETADSLRDFIIALDKEKADHLRYKIVDESVKIFITPYRTTISEDDLEFSQGDYNVELVIALNVEKHDYLDSALTAHGKILHDADVVTVTAGEVRSDLGTIDWHDNEASGVSEMLVSLLGELKTGKAAMDEQIATALLTGIVSATDRFGNEATSPRVMTAAATLMAAGANQHLIAAKLEEASQPDPDEDQGARQGFDGSTFLKEGAATKLVSPPKSDVVEPESEPAPEDDDDDGVITITHTRPNDLDEVARQVMADKQRKAAKAAKAKLEKLTGKRNKQRPEEQPAPQPEPAEPAEPAASAPNQPEADFEPEPEEAPEPQPAVPAAPSPIDIAEDLRRTTEAMVANGEGLELPTISPSVAIPQTNDSRPMTGGTLNATAAQAAEDKRRAIELDQNRTILKHGKPIGSRVPSLSGGAFNASMNKPDRQPSVDIFSQPPVQTYQGYAAPAPAQTQTLPPEYGQAQPSQPLPPSQPMNQAYGVPQPSDAPTLADIEAQQQLGASSPQPQPPLPPMPDFNNLPPLPPMPAGIDPAGLPSLPNVPPNQSAPPPPQDFNPAQFQIPPQQ